MTYTSWYRDTTEEKIVVDQFSSKWRYSNDWSFMINVWIVWCGLYGKSVYCIWGLIVWRFDLRFEASEGGSWVSVNRLYFLVVEQDVVAETDIYPSIWTLGNVQTWKMQITNNTILYHVHLLYCEIALCRNFAHLSVFFTTTWYRAENLRLTFVLRNSLHVYRVSSIYLNHWIRKNMASTECVVDFGVSCAPKYIILIMFQLSISVELATPVTGNIYIDVPSSIRFLL